MKLKMVKVIAITKTQILSNQLKLIKNLSIELNEILIRIL